MLIITDRLTIGQITFIVRVVIQILAYGGLFLLGSIILSHSPRTAPIETHDVLNRIVGKSTSTSSSLKWIVKRVFRKNRDPSPSSYLLVALILSLCYGLFVSLSDVGFIGFFSCEIPGPPFQDVPASVRSESHARTLVESYMLNGTDPSSVNSYRCDAAQDHVFGVNVTERLCTAWRNSTYGDSSGFRILNSTDSDVLMPTNLGRYNTTRKDIFDLNNYFLGASGEIVPNPTIKLGLAVAPHETGVRMVVGVPQLTKHQKVVVPKTLALEVDIGCMGLGMIGQEDTSSLFGRAKDYFLPDDLYKSTRMAKYTGPDNLRDPLAKAADSVRDLMRPWYNSSNVVPGAGYWQSYNSSYSQYSWQTQAAAWWPPSINGVQNADLARFILGNCSEEVHQKLNVAIPSESVKKLPAACALYQMRGSFFVDQGAIQGHSEMVCATTTQVNMVQATLEVDGEGRLTTELNRLPSDLHIVTASYFDIQPSSTGDTMFLEFDPIERYTLSDNAAGNTQHFIYQRYSLGTTTNGLNHGPGSMGPLFSQIGAAMLGVSSLDDTTLTMINSTYFSADTFSTSVVTKWAGGVGASYILASTGYNAWAALGSAPVTVLSTGGKLATCYNQRYSAAFLPLVLAAIAVMCWSLGLLVSSKVKSTKKLENMYGGLAPTIVTPFPGRPHADTILVWEEGTDPHLKPVFNGGMPLPGPEFEMLVPSANTSYPGYGMEK
ncbi:hypothetical protein B0H34DRAFT_727198 [Crassisporium funariophilum]|nr:hypothetical protein B0H34DRAFT_727198 [Crassisporium funariophilum]